MATRYQMYIDGDWTGAQDDAWIDSFDPSTEEAWAQIPAATAADVDRAVTAAAHAMTDGPWSRMTPYKRGRCLENLARLVHHHAQTLAELETRDTGKLIRETIGSASYVPAFYEFYGGLADKIGGATLPMDKPAIHAFTKREPIGVVAAIVPWNSPLMLTAVKLGPALAAGNAVVIKPSEHASIPILEFAKLVHEAGFPPGAVNVVTGLGNPVGETLTRHPLVKRVAFTGGPETARNIVRNSADNFAFVTLELGGKSPQLIFDDANLDSAVNGIVAGIFGASGQSCVAGSRLYVQNRIYDRVISEVIDRSRKIRIGKPQDMASEMGPLATRAQLDRFKDFLSTSREEGGEVLSGGGQPAKLHKGWYVEPTIVACPQPGVRLAEEEIFGPVLSVMRFKDEEDAIKQANASRYGLASGLWTRNLSRAHRLADALHSGIVWVNMYRAASPVAPFGGYGDSGQARESGVDAIYDYIKTKTVWINTSDAPMADPFRVQ